MFHHWAVHVRGLRVRPSDHWLLVFARVRYPRPGTMLGSFAALAARCSARIFSGSWIMSPTTHSIHPTNA